jgi:hypothetical protein
MKLNRRTGLVLPAVAAIAVTSALLTATVALGGSTEGPLATIAKKKRDRRVGVYQGITELGGPVSFAITRRRNVVNFTMPNVPVECLTLQQGVPISDLPRSSRPPFTITAPPMKLQGVAKFMYEVPFDFNGPFQGVHVDGKPDSNGGTLPPGQAPSPGTSPILVNPSQTALKGNAIMTMSNGPFNQVGTERCGTIEVDWIADKVGGKKK